jgi:hypothetical protein
VKHPYHINVHYNYCFNIHIIVIIGHLTNYGQNTYFWTFWTFSHGGKSKNDTKLVSVGHRDLRVPADSADRRESKNKLNK